MWREPSAARKRFRSHEHETVSVCGALAALDSERMATGFFFYSLWGFLLLRFFRVVDFVQICKCAVGVH